MTYWNTVRKWAFGGAVAFLAAVLLTFIVGWTGLAGSDFWNRFVVFPMVLCPPYWGFSFAIGDGDPLPWWGNIVVTLFATTANAAIYAVLGSIWWLIEIKEWKKR